MNVIRLVVSAGNGMQLAVLNGCSCMLSEGVVHVCITGLKETNVMPLEYFLRVGTKGKALTTM